jgi:hypothetical protein
MLDDLRASVDAVEKRRYVTVPGVEHRFSSPPSLGIVTIATELSWLSLYFQYFDKYLAHSLISSKKCKNCALLCYYAVSGGNSLPTFRDNLSVPSSEFKNPKSVKITSTRCAITQKSAVHSYFEAEA